MIRQMSFKSVTFLNQTRIIKLWASSGGIHRNKNWWLTILFTFNCHGKLFSHNNYHRFHLSHVFADDLSKNKVSEQSPKIESTQIDPYRYVAGNAVDRNVTTCMRTGVIGPNSPEKSAWWKVDLGGVYNIYSVNILFKNYDGYGIYMSISYDKQISLQKWLFHKFIILVQ